MQILYIGSFRLPNYDAAAARVLNVARALRACGHDVRFISWGGNMRIEDKLDDGRYCVDGFPYVVTGELGIRGGLFKKALGWFTRGNKTKAILKEELGHYDVVITYNCSLIKWLVPFCKKNGVFLITDLTEWYDNNEQRLIEKPGYYIDMNFVQPRIKNKILISSYLDNHFHDSHNIVVPAMCDASEKKWIPNQSIADGALYRNEAQTLIYAGNPARKDAIHFVIRAVQRLSKEEYPIRFVILGISREDYFKKYSDLLPDGELSGNIQFLGRVSQDLVPSYYAKADFMVLLRESTRKNNAGFPTKFAESFISGTPVIANITSDLGQYLKDGVTGFVVNNPNEDDIYYILKNKVATINKDSIDVMRRNVREMSSHFDYHTYIEPLRAFFDNLVF